MLILFIIILFALPSILLMFDFLEYLIHRKRLYNKNFLLFLEITSMVALPVLYLWLFDDKTNDCCAESAAFAPGHKPTVYTLIFLCIATYFYSAYANRKSSPVLHVMINIFLLLGFVLNIAIAIHTDNILLWAIGNIPVAILILLELIRNHTQAIHLLGAMPESKISYIEMVAWKIISQPLYIKIPVLFVLVMPLLAIISSFLLIAGQKPDSIIRAFTDTYKHGFSQLDHLCDNVECGGHFLCSVAANGHAPIVKPFRYGERHGRKIICNRQLLIANAFEEVVRDHLPGVHRVIRHQYNKVGNVVHRHYHIFNNKWISDIIYVLMKPAEIFFLLVIYISDEKPENRIAMQYVNTGQRRDIENGK